ncbi:class I SAM-dependent methyltransferase [Leptolyngbya sp. 15MV]|nr:class I SAM-dependent methyltransferase [Leptolyngbya sp. 15MV]
MSATSAYWESVYRSKRDRETSWFQEEPNPSLDLVRTYAHRGGRIVDVGGGSSALAGRLAADGFDVTVLDVSSAAIERAKARSGELAQRIHWIIGDVTQAHDLGQFDVWHDRAVFHFLTNPDDRRRYVDLAERSIVVGGHLIMATFALDGPEKCSGLPVVRYDEPALHATVGASFTTLRAFQHAHITPWGKPQGFLFTIMRRQASVPDPRC